ncbi:pantoate--beta-alanine ligase [Jatrophihabitans sp. DSM 45814]
MIVVHSRAELAAVRRDLPAPVGLVPTLGALHAGHASLIDAARRARGGSGSVLVTIFLNPMQFGANEDLSTYPRMLDADLALCEAHGADLVWVPAVEEIYRGGPSQTSVVPGPLGADLEGAVRPTHFEGVLTVVAKFFALIRPDAAFFGEKDYQQLTLIRRMNVDLELGVEVVGVETVREPDGLALSSRNVYLGSDDRQRALVLSRALRSGQAAAASGPTAVLDAARAVYTAEPTVTADYLELRAVDLAPAPTAGAARLLTAAWVGPTRLIDNLAIELGGSR